jgi:hypothetical protein
VFCLFTVSALAENVFQGDLDFDGDVDGTDLAIFGQNYGEQYSTDDRYDFTVKLLFNNVTEATATDIATYFNNLNGCGTTAITILKAFDQTAVRVSFSKCKISFLGSSKILSDIRNRYPQAVCEQTVELDRNL